LATAKLNTFTAIDVSQYEKVLKIIKILSKNIQKSLNQGKTAENFIIVRNAPLLLIGRLKHSGLTKRFPSLHAILRQLHYLPID
jgi:hypothetical protein